MTAHLHQYELLLKWLGIISIITFTVSILLIPWLIGRLPEDYFIRQHYPSSKRLLFQSLFLFVLAVLRNIFGAVLLLAGIAMLFLPGQGILTIILGLSMLNFPGKHKLLLKLIQRSSIQKGLNWIRSKTNRPPFIWKSSS